MKRKIIYLSVVALFSVFNSCELDYQPLDSVANTTYWQTESDAEKAVNNVYKYLGNTDIQAFISCATDDSYSWSNWPSDIQYAGNGSATTSTGIFQSHWSHYYKMIAACNDVTDNIDKVTTLSEGELNRYKAEVRVLRAYAYSQLTGLYGDVPLIKNIQAMEDFKPSRTPKSEVVSFIVSELEDITDNSYLPVTYDDADHGRITQGFALSLLARTLLYNEEWAAAAVVAKKVMDLDVYTIDNDYLSLFNGTNKNSKEIILAAQYVKSTYPNPMATWIGGPSLTGWSQVVPLDALVKAYGCIDGKTIDESPLYNKNAPFENRDPRLKLTIIVPGSTVNGITIDVSNPTSIDRLGVSNSSFSGYYYKKYIPADIEGNWDGNSYNDIVILRYAEVLLTYAEAKVELNEADATVLNAINQVRGRKGVEMPPVTTTNISELREIIRRERRVEFPLEDNRLFDIRRWHIAGDVMSGTAYGILNNFDSSRDDYGKNVKVEERNFNPNRDYLWPVPLNEVGLNPNLLPNNTGW